jgi:hypothetical protein
MIGVRRSGLRPGLWVERQTICTIEQPELRHALPQLPKTRQRPGEIIMADDKNSSDVIINLMTKNLEQARGAMTNYLQFMEKSLSVSPIGSSSQATTLKGYVDRNVAATFDFSEQLLHAKDFQDVVRIQTEFLQTQFRVLTDQAKDVVEMTKPTVIFPRE